MHIENRATGPIADRNRTLITSVRDNKGELTKLSDSRALFLVVVLRLCVPLFDNINSYRAVQRA